MWDIWANSLLPKALISCPKSIKSPNLVALSMCVRVSEGESRNAKVESQPANYRKTK